MRVKTSAFRRDLQYILGDMTKEIVFPPLHPQTKPAEKDKGTTLRFDLNLWPQQEQIKSLHIYTDILSNLIRNKIIDGT